MLHRCLADDQISDQVVASNAFFFTLTPLPSPTHRTMALEDPLAPPDQEEDAMNDDNEVPVTPRALATIR